LEFKYTDNQKIDAIDQILQSNIPLISSDVSYSDIFQKLFQQIQSFVPQLKYEEKEQPALPTSETIQNTKGYEQPPQSPPEKRKLPVKPKEKVFDEWAAVIRHQDELELLKKEKEIQSQKIQQNQYRELLEEQIKIRKMNADNSKHSNSTRSNRRYSIN
jgi:hypothetical protein